MVVRAYHRQPWSPRVARARTPSCSHRLLPPLNVNCWQESVDDFTQQSTYGIRDLSKSSIQIMHAKIIECNNSHGPTIKIQTVSLTPQNCNQEFLSTEIPLEQMQSPPDATQSRMLGQAWCSRDLWRLASIHICRWNTLPAWIQNKQQWGSTAH